MCVHIGISVGLKYLLKNYPDLRAQSTIKLDCSWDGIPIFKSSSKALWPICGAVSNSRFPVFPIGMFVGETKPKNSDGFFRVFIDEMDDLETNGFNCEIYGKKVIKCHIHLVRNSLHNIINKKNDFGMLQEIS